MQIISFIEESETIATDSSFAVVSIFQGHNLHAGTEMLMRNNFISNANTIIWLITFLLLLSTLIIYLKKIPTLLTSLVSTVSFNKMLKNSNKLLFPLFAIFLLISSQIITSIISSQRFVDSSSTTYIIVFLCSIVGIFLMIYIKFLLAQLIFYLSDDTSSGKLFIKNQLLFYSFFAMVLFLIGLSLLLNWLDIEIFHTQTTYVTLFFIFLYRFIRTLIIIISKTKNWYFHIFLYLCTLEILYPALLIVLCSKIYG